MTEILESMEDIASKLNEEIQKMKKASEDHIVITYKLDKITSMTEEMKKMTYDQLKQCLNEKLTEVNGVRDKLLQDVQARNGKIARIRSNPLVNCNKSIMNDLEYIEECDKINTNNVSIEINKIVKQMTQNEEKEYERVKKVDKYDHESRQTSINKNTKKTTLNAIQNNDKELIQSRTQLIGEKDFNEKIIKPLQSIIQYINANKSKEMLTEMKLEERIAMTEEMKKMQFDNLHNELLKKCNEINAIQEKKTKENSDSDNMLHIIEASIKSLQDVANQIRAIKRNNENSIENGSVAINKLTDMMNVNENNKYNYIMDEDKKDYENKVKQVQSKEQKVNRNPILNPVKEMIRRRERGCNKQIEYEKQYDASTSLFTCDEKQILVEFIGKGGANELKEITTKDSIPTEHIMYCGDETNNKTLLMNRLLESGGQLTQVKVIIPSDYKKAYYPYVLGSRKDFNLDNSDLPIIIPIPASTNQPSVVYVNQYQNSNTNDRIKFNISLTGGSLETIN